MRIDHLVQSPQPTFSFEFFPPKTPVGEVNLIKTVQSLQPLEPSFVSVTCGAMGTSCGKTVEWAKQIRDEANLEPLVHLTCLGASEEFLNKALEEIAKADLKNILALRGDAPAEGVGAKSHCQHANELIELIRKRYPGACIAAACYPEKHTEAPSMISDLEAMKLKAGAGADVFLTQLFFDNRHYFEFVGRARSMGITQPIVPGIMPIQNVDQIKRFTGICGASIPKNLMGLLEQYQDTPRAVFHIGVAHAIAQSQELLNNGAPGIHFYTLNKSPATRLVVQALRQA